MKTLISMVDFVEEIKDYVHESHNNERGLELIFNYSEFLKQPLTLGMFVSCDEEGDVLEEPNPDNYNWGYLDELKIYNKAKEKVLFENFPLDAAKHHIGQNRTIQYFTTSNLPDVFLTESAINQISI